MFGGLEDIIWTNIDILTLHCDLDLECSNPFKKKKFSQDILAYDVYYQTKFGCQGINSSEDIVERVIFRS